MDDARDHSSGHLPARQVLQATTRFALRRPATALLLAVGFAVGASVLAWLGLTFKTDRADLIDPDAEYQQRWLRYTDEFGDALEDVVVVVEGPNPEAIQRVLDDLGQQVLREPKLFTNVLYRIDPSALRRKGLQFRTPEQLQALLAQIREAVRLRAMAEAGGDVPSQFDQMTGGLAQLAAIPGPEAAARRDALLPQIAAAVGRLLATMSPPQTATAGGTGGLPPVRMLHPSPSLGNLSAGVGAGEASGTGGQATSATPAAMADARPRYLMNDRGTMGFLKAQLVAQEEDFSGTSPGIDRLRTLVAEARQRYPKMSVGLTGIPVLESDEMHDSQQSMTWSSILSFAGVALLMVWGFRRMRYPVMAMTMLVFGMAWSFGCATLTVGHLNILSVSFAAMLVGLGIDFAVVYLARYLELRHEGRTLPDAVWETSESMGPGIFTAAVTTAVTFFTACLTDFAGVAELGLIAGCGILLCTTAALLTLPAMLALWDRRLTPGRIPLPLSGRVFGWFTGKHPLAVIGAWLLVLAAAGVGVRKAGYDGNLLHMQAEGLDSVKWQNRIFEQSDHSLLFAVSLADSPEQAIQLKQRFEALPSVGHVEEIASMLPAAPAAQTRPLIAALRSELAWRRETPPPRPVNPATFGKRLEELSRLLAAQTAPLAGQVRGQIEGFLDRYERLPLDRQVQLLQGPQAQLAGMSAMFAQLWSVADPEPVGVADLPPALVSRFVGPHGKWLLQVYPKEQIWDGEPLERFIADVRSVDPDATGTPLQTYEASRAIRKSYEQAGLYSLLAVSLLLWLDLRSVRDSLLALLPPLLGMLMTFGILGWTDLKLNPANLILLPLILGMGVDGGVHVVHDYRRQSGRYRMSVSTLNSLVLTAGTSMVGFGSLMLAEHRGLFSLGLVLTVGIGCYLVVSLLLLPSILTCLGRPECAMPPQPPPPPKYLARKASPHRQAV